MGSAMDDARDILLEDRGLVAVAGDDRYAFLQGHISNDTRRVDGTRAVYAAFLTAEGKYLHDFFVVAIPEEGLVLDCEAGRSDDLLRRLRPYRLRAKVTFAERTIDWQVAALIGSDVPRILGLSAEDHGAATAFAGGVAYIDPRLAAAGARAILPRADAAERLTAAGFTEAPASAYEALRLDLGLADGSRDITVDRSILLECGFDELHGVDWDKGCFLGQELTARTKYRSLIKKRLVPVAIEGQLPPHGTPVMNGAREVGEIRSGAGDRALAMLRLEALAEAAAGPDIIFTAGEARLRPLIPSWLTL